MSNILWGAGDRRVTCSSTVSCAGAEQGTLKSAFDAPRPLEKAYRVRIEVTDTGVGISSEDQKKLFGQYVQFSAGMLQKGMGSGLGLWISKGIVELHGGKIGAFSEGEGCGSTFFVELPLYPYAEEGMDGLPVGLNESAGAAASASVAQTPAQSLALTRSLPLTPARSLPLPLPLPPRVPNNSVSVSRSLPWLPTRSSPARSRPQSARVDDSSDDRTSSKSASHRSTLYRTDGGEDESSSRSHSHSSSARSVSAFARGLFARSRRPSFGPAFIEDAEELFEIEKQPDTAGRSTKAGRSRPVSSQPEDTPGGCRSIDMMYSDSYHLILHGHILSLINYFALFFCSVDGLCSQVSLRAQRRRQAGRGGRDAGTPRQWQWQRQRRCYRLCAHCDAVHG
jgi:hypothetical protein